ncbi:MAG TPA: biotin carboxylase N-terminal domain-containing protein [Candidatus Limnocylindrales bacterium]|jgi:acetyl-CoA/propionyl-CoA carboxylase biotin carboxyl carrier protein
MTDRQRRGPGSGSLNRPLASAASTPPPAPGRQIRTLFIANRGEIATRIRRSCLKLGIEAVIPAVDAAGGLDLLDIEAVLADATAAGADAIHPGFGFLAESAEFAEAVESSGMRWVGPPPSAIRAMGDKAAARRLATQLGIPVIPGYDDPDQSEAALEIAAVRIGFPILVKPSSGGGGKGMRVVRDRGALPDAIASARREASAAFGDDRLILERLVEGPRHVEIQVLFDAQGNGIHLGERDCSIQRRHQKVLEEAPSPGIDRDVRDRMAGDALELASAVGYVSAGTCEFLVDDRGEYHFLEMNTRLQVEHPVTEAITGRDLVADQIRIVAGERLDADQTAADAARTAGGHAVEVRLYAEDAEAGFLPATGRVEALRWPIGEGIRVDAGIDTGTEVSGRFDPMLAKIVAHGRDRDDALARLTRALDETLVLGLVTNLRFLRWLVREPVVRDGQARVDTLDRIWPPDEWSRQVAIPDAAWEAAAALLAQRDGSSSVWAGGWRLNAPSALRLASEDESRTTRLPTAPATAVESVRVGGVVYVDVDGRSVGFELAPPPDVDRALRQAAAHGQAGGSIELRAPMPGSVLVVHQAAGAKVAAGDPIVTLEAMKMEHVVAAPVAGQLVDLAVHPADQVTRGQLLATIEA